MRKKENTGAKVAPVVDGKKLELRKPLRTEGGG